MSHLFLLGPSERRNPAGAKPAFESKKWLSSISEFVKLFVAFATLVALFL
jgi:hypothetical protein